MQAGAPGSRFESKSLQREIRPGACPMANQAKGYPFEVAVSSGQSISGVILADHVKSIDWKARAEKLGRCPAEAIDEVRARLAPLIGC